MKIKEEKKPAHFLICTHYRDSKASCQQKGSLHLQETLKKLSKVSGWRKDIRVLATSCLGHCEKGIACRLEPQGLVFTKVKETDAEMLADFLKSSLP